MKRSLIKSFGSGIVDCEHGESYGKILSYFLPEYITAMVLYSLIYFVDSYFIAHLKSTSTFATLGTTNTLLHFLIKMAEGISVGTIVVTGYYNGLSNYERSGKTLIDAFWITVLVGSCISLMLYIGAPWIYYWYGVPQKMIVRGAPYLRIRSISIFCMFVYFAFIGFLRGVKNTRTPMIIFVCGALLFLFFDYVLIFGMWGFPRMKFLGSAMASTIQYIFMLIASALFVLMSKEYTKYSICLFTEVASWKRIKHLLWLSAPVVLDKAILAIAYLWLGAMINPMGVYAIASYSIIKDLERFAIMPAAAFAQVITFLASNAQGIGDWKGTKSNIKKVVLLASICVCAILFVFSVWPKFFIQFFDHKEKFTAFAAQIVPFLSVLVFFDLLQLIMAGALRGSANVKYVFITRLCIVFLYFIPVSTFLAQLNLKNDMLRFLLIYGSFYLGNGLMSVVYIIRFRGERWKSKSV